MGKWIGLGQSTIKNSTDAARAADAALILVSRTYLERYKNDPHGPLAAEFDELANRYSQSRIPVVPLAIDPHEELTDFRHERFGQNAPFFVGRALVTETEEEISEAVSEALNFIDKILKSAGRSS